MTITQERLKELLYYDPETGVFTWTFHNKFNAHKGKPCTYTANGRVQIMIKGKPYLAHRLAWLYVNGSFPSKHIDHINGDPVDNRISNLREATPTENAQNTRIRSDNTSGFPGVRLDTKKGKWHAQIRYCGKRYHLGFYPEKELAIRAYLAAKKKLHTFNPVPRDNFLESV